MALVNFCAAFAACPLFWTYNLNWERLKMNHKCVKLMILHGNGQITGWLWQHIAPPVWLLMLADTDCGYALTPEGTSINEWILCCLFPGHSVNRSLKHQIPLPISKNKNSIEKLLTYTIYIQNWIWTTCILCSIRFLLCTKTICRFYHQNFCPDSFWLVWRSLLTCREGDSY